MNPTRTETIKRFLIIKTHPDLADLYSHDMEVQVNIAQDEGELYEGDFKGKTWRGWTDGIEIWKNFRIPYKAKSDPEYDDRPMNFNLETHVEGIGMTGWDWVDRCSRWVAYDFDALIGHSDKHDSRLNDEQLKAIQKAAMDIPWITVRKSTGGRGLHLYVFLKPVSTKNHNEHAALARAILGLMSAITGFDFQSKVDICGGNMWVWHRKITKENDGLALIKQGGLLAKPPANWMDHIKVISGRKRKATPKFVEDSLTEDEKIFEELTGQFVKIQLDDGHKRLLLWLDENNCQWWWDQDHYMLVTHTYYLNKAQEELNFRGIFKTDSAGTEAPNDHNCFLFPLRNSAWVVRRYSVGVNEASTWDQDAAGYTRCFFNKIPDLQVASRAFSGLEDPAGGFVFREAEQAAKAAALLGIHIQIPAWANSRRSKLKIHKSGRLVFEIDQLKDDAHYSGDGSMKNWLAKGKAWTQVLNKRIIQDDAELEVGNFDDLLRHLVTIAGDDMGWVLAAGGWKTEPLTHIRVALGSMGISAKEATTILGNCIRRCWTIVNEPFQAEYPGDRKWNRDAVQLRFVPSAETDDLSFPHWQIILDHIGEDLNLAVKTNGWCKAHGVLKGADYLKLWIASIFQYPKEPLPYLFLFGPENSGKSILHESLQLLLTKGWVKADTALTSNSDFNAELEGKIVCAVEEVNLRVSKVAYNRIKDWVTSQYLPIHKKGLTPYHVQNTTHWIQCANDQNFCPVFVGDTRITMIYVKPLDLMQMIPKKRLMSFLIKEAPDFIAEILSVEIPESPDRLNIPIVDTDKKLATAMANQSLLEQFISEICYEVPGKMIKFGEFYGRLKEWLPVEQWDYWTKNKVGRELPVERFPKGRVTSDAGQFYIGNISWKPLNPDDKKLPRLKVVGSGNNIKLVSG